MTYPKNNMKITLGFILILWVVSLTSAEIDSLTQTQGECITLRQEYINSTYTNLTSISYPNTTTIIIGRLMTKVGATYNYSFCETRDLGEYSYCTVTDVDGIKTSVCTPFYITTSGREAITEGESSTIVVSIIIMLVLSAFFFILGSKVDNMGGKIVLVGTAAVLLLATLLFSLVIMNQTIGGFSTIIEGYATFWFVVKIITGIAITALTVFTLWFTYTIWMVKRGFRD
jgi:hypothetical protein